MKFHNIIKTKEEYRDLKEATNISVTILRELRDNVKIGVSAGHINDLAAELCSKYKVKPSFLGVPGTFIPFPANVCISVNDEILHAIPHRDKIFNDGDIVKVDFGIVHKGFYTDHCTTVGLGKLSTREESLIRTAKLCIDSAVEQAIIGNTVSDISYSLQTIAELGKFNYVTTYCGHGIGKSLHLAPEIPSFASDYGDEIKLEEGMILCIENQITIGSSDLELDNDGWTLRTIDGSKGAMFEHMVIVRKKRPEILTLID